MSQGYRLNGGVIGFKHLWESDKTGVWDIKSPFVNNNIPPVPFGEYLYTSIGTHTFTVPTDVTIISVLVIGGGGGGMYWSCLLYTSPSPRDVEESRMPSSA